MTRAEVEKRAVLLRAIGWPGEETLDAWLNERPPDADDVAWLRRQGLAPLAAWTLSKQRALSRLQPEVEEGLRQVSRAAVVADLRQDRDCVALLRAFEGAGVASVLLKGAVLAPTVYPEPWCRTRCDIDVWVDPADYPRVVEVLASLGYVEAQSEKRSVALALRFGGETQLRGTRSGQGLVEPHFQAFQGEWCRHTTAVDHAGIWGRRRPFARGGATGATMATEDLLLHVCVHFGVNHQFTVSGLRSVLDVHLLAKEGDLDWDAVARRAREWRIATVTWTALSLAVTFFDAPVPAATLEALRPGRVRRALIRFLRLEEGIVATRPGGYNWRRGLLWLVMTDRLSSVARFVGRAVVPETEWLRIRHDAPSAPLLSLLLRHWGSLLRHRHS